MKQYQQIKVPSVEEQNYKLCETFDAALESKAFKKGLYDVLSTILIPSFEKDTKKMDAKNRQERRKYYHIINTIIGGNMEEISLEEIAELEQFLEENEYEMSDHGNDIIEANIILPETVKEDTITVENLLKKLKEYIEDEKNKRYLDKFQEQTEGRYNNVSIYGYSGSRKIIQADEEFLLENDEGFDIFSRIEKTEQEGIFIAIKSGEGKLNLYVIVNGNYHKVSLEKDNYIVDDEIYQFPKIHEIKDNFFLLSCNSKNGDKTRDCILTTEDEKVSIYKDIDKDEYNFIAGYTLIKYIDGKTIILDQDLKQINMDEDNGHESVVDIYSGGGFLTLNKVSQEYSFYDFDGKLLQKNISIKGTNNIMYDSKGYYYFRKVLFGKQKVYLSR